MNKAPVFCFSGFLSPSKIESSTFLAFVHIHRLPAIVLVACEENKGRGQREREKESERERERVCRVRISLVSKSVLKLKANKTPA